MNLLFFLCGCLVGGTVIWFIIKHPKKLKDAGTLRIIDSQEDGTYMFAELTIGLDELGYEKQVSMHVNTIPHA